MNRIQLLALAGLSAISLSLPLPALAERDIKSQQVQFAKGRSSALVEGNIVGDQVADYKLRARAGQTLRVNLKASNASTYYNVLPPGSTGEAIYNGSMDGVSSIDRTATRWRVHGAGLPDGPGQEQRPTLNLHARARRSPAQRRRPPADRSRALADPLGDAPLRAGQGKFNATGKIPCAQAPGQPMGQCDFGVARAAGGSAALSITMPDGRKRMIFFEKGRATGADLSQADGDMSFSATKEADLYKVRAGKERYEIPEAVVFGG